MCVNVCVRVFIIRTLLDIRRQPGMVASPPCGQLNREYDPNMHRTYCALKKSSSFNIERDHAMQSGRLGEHPLFFHLNSLDEPVHGSRNLFGHLVVRAVNKGQRGRRELVRQSNEQDDGVDCLILGCRMF